jgi:transcriptional regulator with XRE-family HTH domain
MSNPSASLLDVEIKRSLTASIKKKMSEDNLSISALAERMGTGRTAVRRVLDANNTSITFRSMTRAAQAVGLQIKLTAEPMSPDDLGKLAHRLARSKSRASSAKLAAQITRSFYEGA